MAAADGLEDLEPPRGVGRHLGPRREGTLGQALRAVRHELCNRFLKTTEWIKQNLPYARVSGGISNLSFSFRGTDKVREAIHSVFLFYAVKAGLDMGIVNPGMLQVYTEIEPDLLHLVEDVVLNRRKDSTERLVKFAEGIKNEGKKAEKEDAWRQLGLLTG